MARISNERHSHISVYTHVFFFCLCSCCFFASPSVFGSVFCNPFFPYGVRPTQYLLQPAIKYFSCHKTKSTQRRKKEEGRRKKEEGRRKKEEGRRKKDDWKAENERNNTYNKGDTSNTVTGKWLFYLEKIGGGFHGAHVWKYLLYI
ncbi:hypothetical protein B0T09DRAFT_329265 [Sordaria sp. MPI-SDFR-AT-0083]|nr:hypothetical protein B0T09DRAFT_329265 [Sordaria sp. MPI-SDFR-AT-0083]